MRVSALESLRTTVLDQMALNSDLLKTYLSQDSRHYARHQHDVLRMKNLQKASHHNIKHK